MPNRPAKRSDAYYLPMNGNLVPLKFEQTYSAAEFELIKWGHLPEEIKQDWTSLWFAYFEDNWLYLHHQPDGYCYYQAKFTLSNEEDNQLRFKVEEAWGSAGPDVVGVGTHYLEVIIQRVLLTKNRWLLHRRRSQLERTAGQSPDQKLIDNLIKVYLTKDEAGNWIPAKALTEAELNRLSEPLLAILKVSPPHPLRFQALWIVGCLMLKTPSLVEVVSRLGAGDEDDTVREEAFQVLAEMELTGQEWQKAMPALVRALRSDPTSEVRQVAALGLGQSQLPEVIPVLIEVIGDRDGTVQTRAVDSLRQFSAEQIVEPLMTALWQAEKEDSNRIDLLAWAFNWLNLEVALPHLIESLRGEDLEQVSRSCLALGYLGDKRSCLRVDEGVEVLINLLKHPALQVRHASAHALYRIADPKAVQPLIDLFENEEDSSIQMMIVSALGRIKDPQATLWLMDLLKDKNIRPELQNSIIAWLSQKKEVKVFDVALELLENEESYTRMCGAFYLGSLADPRAVEPLVKALKDEDITVRWMASNSLGKLGDARAIPALRELVAVSTYERWLGRYLKDVALEAIEKIEMPDEETQ
ncbi:MAG TPA: HEAT repeat domain-containing protein [Chloroflexia bacterium]|nr:HEAT repeat domain-containing protein [Chloroflexia bacterium]